MRLITRSDFDGLVCAVLLVEKGIVNEYKFVHPKDVQDGKVEVTENDVLANIPYVPGCGLWFDHHSSEEERLQLTESFQFKGASYPALSAAHVVWDYYGGGKAFNPRLLELMEAVNKSDSGSLQREDILNPEGWILLSFVMDPRTGLGRFNDYRISNYKLMEDMIQYCRTMTAEEVLALQDVVERTTRYFEQSKLFVEMLRAHSHADGNVIVTDLRDCETIFAGNRFMVYALYPDQNIEIRVMWGREKKNVVFSVGHSVLKRTSKTNVGALMLKNGGGGHEKVGTCQVDTADADRVLEELIARMKADG